MEYRRRRRPVRAARRRGRGSGSFAGTLFCIVLLAAAIVYLIGVSSAGTWVARNVVAPVFKTLGIAQPETETLAGDAPARDGAEGLAAPVTKTLRMPARTYYLLQMGVYANAENAEKQAAALQELGAGGYIYQDAGKYRVLAACYLNAESITQVRTRLSGEGLESTSFPLEQTATEWIVTASESQMEALSAALTQLGALPDTLYNLMYSFDREKKTVSAGKEALSGTLTALQAAYGDLRAAVDGQSDNADALLRCMAEILEQLGALASFEGEDSTAFTAKLKYAQLAAADAICRFAANMSA